MANKDDFTVPGISGPAIPDILYFGREEGKWPIVVFEVISHAMFWKSDAGSSRKRHIFRVDMNSREVAEMAIVPAVDARLVELRPGSEEERVPPNEAPETPGYGHWVVCSIHTERPTLDCPEGAWTFPSVATNNTPNRHDHWTEEL